MKSYFLLFLHIFSFIIISKSYDYKKSPENKKIVYTIPVIFHIVLNDNKKLEDVSKEEIHLLIKLLNDDFNARNKGLENIHKNFKKDIANCKISFVLASSIYPKINFKDISYHLSSDNSYSSKFIEKPEDDIKLKKYGYQDSKKYLNIWITDISEPNKFGYATPKSMVGELRDGVVIDYKFINESYTLTHEIGHFFGLKHLWGGVCGELLNLIGICSGDGIKDTPRQKGPTELNNCTPRKSCEFGKSINVQNFMDYSYCIGMFTKGQAKEMRDYIKNKRSGLLWVSNYNINNVDNSVLEKNKLRQKIGQPFNFGGVLKYKTNTNLHLKRLFDNEIKIPFNNSSLDALGLKQIGTNKFKDSFTGEIVKQRDIYERINIEKAKALYKDNSTTILTNEKIDISRISVYNTELVFSPDLKGRSVRFLEFNRSEKTLQMIKKGKLFLRTNWTPQEIEVEEYKLVYNSFNTQTVNGKPVRTPNNGEIVYKGNTLTNIISKLNEFYMENYDAVNKITWVNKKALRTCFVYVTKIKVNNQIIDISSKGLYPISIKY